MSNRAYPQLRLLHGTELNIGPGGGLDWPGEFLHNKRSAMAPRQRPGQQGLHGLSVPDAQAGR